MPRPQEWTTPSRSPQKTKTKTKIPEILNQKRKNSWVCSWKSTYQREIFKKEKKEKEKEKKTSGAVDEGAGVLAALHLCENTFYEYIQTHSVYENALYQYMRTQSVHENTFYPYIQTHSVYENTFYHYMQTHSILHDENTFYLCIMRTHSICICEHMLSPPPISEHILSVYENTFSNTFSYTDKMCSHTHIEHVLVSPSMSLICLVCP